MNRVVPLRTLAILLVALIGAPAAAAPRFGIEGSLRYGELTREADPPLDDFGPTPKYRPSWSLGAVVGQPLGGPLALVSGVRFVETREEFAGNVTISDGSSITMLDFDFHTQFQTIELPVSIEFRPFASGPVFEAGASVAYLHAVTTQIETSESTVLVPLQYAEIFEDVGTFDGNDIRFYNRWHGSIGLGTGWDFPTGGGIATMRLRYAHGITDVQKSDAIDRKVRAFEFTAGWRW